LARERACAHCCGVTHREGYLDILMVAIVGALIALAVVILIGATLGSV